MTHPELNPIARQNDAFRQTLAVIAPQTAPADAPPGSVMITPRVGELPLAEHLALLLVVRNYASFNPDNDPYGEHDFGSIDLHGTRWFWKIDYYADATCQWGSEDPADPEKCFRVLTILHASEY